MATVKTKLFDLVKAQLKKSDGDKALDTLTEMVEENQNNFSNELFEAKKAVKGAKKIAASLEANASALGADIIAAERNVKVLEANVTSLEEIIARRF